MCVDVYEYVICHSLWNNEGDAAESGGFDGKSRNYAD